MLFCQYCNRECKNINSLKNHELRCKENPNRKITKTSGMKGKTAWNKGLTKDTDERVKKYSEKLKGNPSPGRCLTEKAELERRRKISEYAKSRNFGGLTPRSGRGKKGWYKGFFCDSTYELVFVIYNLDNNISFKRCERIYEYLYEDKIHEYHPDFEISDGSLIEIKGYHTNLVDIKLASVHDRPIKVLYEKDLEYAFNWVKSHYTYKNLFDLYEK